MLGLEPLPYELDLECPLPWPSSHETLIGQDYPFSSTQDESIDDFVIRRYLETLWLPESIMPLHHLVRSLQRVPSSSIGPHPLHASLKPLLLSVRATQEKYHSELPQILQDGGGAGELEETIMWFSWSKEKFEGSADTNGGDLKISEEEWKKSWMDRLERREVQIQILLYLQILALPPPSPATPVSSPKSSKKRKRIPPRKPPTPAKSLFPPTSSVESTVIAAPPTPAKSAATSTTTNVDEDLSLEDRLEFFMDRLSLWQLVSSLNLPTSSQAPGPDSRPRPERDWMQVFCEDVVQPLFKDRLPEQCGLLRTKVFPHSPFSDNSSETSSLPSPDLRAVSERKTKGKRPTSPLRLVELQKSRPEHSQPTSRRAGSQEPGMVAEYRSRSRSVSVSVEEVRSRGASRGGVASSKNLFKDEVEMRRTATRAPTKSKSVSTKSQPTRNFSRQNSAADPFSSSQPGTSRTHSPSQAQGYKTLAMDTPVKRSMQTENDDGTIDSPDALQLIGKSRRGRDEVDDKESQTLGKPLVMDTPVKKRKR